MEKTYSMETTNNDLDKAMQKLVEETIAKQKEEDDKFNLWLGASLYNTTGINVLIFDETKYTGGYGFDPISVKEINDNYLISIEKLVEQNIEDGKITTAYKLNVKKREDD